MSASCSIAYFTKNWKLILKTLLNLCFDIKGCSRRDFPVLTSGGLSLFYCSAFGSLLYFSIVTLFRFAHCLIVARGDVLIIDV